MKRKLYAMLAMFVLSGCAAQSQLPPPDINQPRTQLDAIGYLVVDKGIWGKNLCLATLVASDEIVTAAHCIVDGDKILEPEKIIFRARNWNINAKVVEVVTAPDERAINLFGFGKKQSWIAASQDYARLRIDAPLGEILGAIPLFKLSAQTVFGGQEFMENILSGQEFSAADISEGKFRIQHGCRLHEGFARLNDQVMAKLNAAKLKKLSTSAMVKKLMSALGIGENGSTTRKLLENGYFMHTCYTKSKYPGGPLLRRLASGDFELIGVNAEGLELPAAFADRAQSWGLNNLTFGQSRLIYICREGKECQENFWPE